MANRKSYHVLPAPKGGWNVKKQGSHRATRTFSTKKEAMEWAREISKNHQTDLYIHNKDGKIADRHSYAADPYPSKDW